MTMSLLLTLCALAVCLLGVCLLTGFYISSLSEKDWRSEESRSGYEKTFKMLMSAGCSVPGLRLMCSPEGEPFALKHLSFWDTVLGCFFYAVLYLAFLWVMTPFPDINTHFIFVLQFEPRSEQHHHRQPVVHPPLHQQQDHFWHPAGGEGPHLPNF